MSTFTPRSVRQVIPAMQASDGAGVRIRRSLGASPSLRVDPFLMLDEFGSAEAADYIGGFPPHPHRGFETVTYTYYEQLNGYEHLKALDIGYYFYSGAYADE
ncbi:MAG: pirin family protein, partial [Oceanococcaceae bacterium]